MPAELTPRLSPIEWVILAGCGLLAIVTGQWPIAVVLVVAVVMAWFGGAADV